MTLVIAVAALILAAAALALAITVMRQNADTVTELRKLRRTAKQLGERVTDLLEWSTDVHAAVFPDQELADDDTDPGPHTPDQLIVIDHPITADQAAQIRDDATTAMPAVADRPQP
jgi:hypothetical protein